MSRRHELLVWWLAAVVAAFCGALVVAELADVYLKSGVRLRGDVTVTETEVVVRNELGETRLPKELVERVVPVAPTVSHPTTEPATQPATPATGPATRPASAPAAQPETQPATRPVEEGEPEAAATTRPALLAPPLLGVLDIQRLRLSELRLDGPAEKVRVRFSGADQNELPREILKELATRPDFRPQWEDVLLRGTPQEKLQVIAALTGTKYAERITINSDPEVFQTFRGQVLPAVIKSCARSGCHAGEDAAVFRLPASTSHNDAYVYTVFALLDHLESAQGPLINRDNPEGGVREGSVLLSYMLPEHGNPQAHPAIQSRLRFSAVVRGRDNPLYTRIRDWIDSLRTPHPNYNLDYKFPDVIRPPEEPTSAPAP